MWRGEFEGIPLAGSQGNILRYENMKILGFSNRSGISRCMKNFTFPVGVSSQFVKLAYFGYEITPDFCLLDNETKKSLTLAVCVTIFSRVFTMTRKMFGC